MAYATTDPYRLPAPPLWMKQMPDYKALIAQNGHFWDTAEFDAGMMARAKTLAVKICDPKAVAVYKHLQELTSVPWWVIGVIHYRESNLSWARSLAQGDPWNKVSIHKPARRGPFKSFVEAGEDALKDCAPFAARWKDWSPGGALTLLELYNGLGYERHGTPSPYVWSGTQHYRHGKYVSDGKYAAAVVDKQLGCAIILRAMEDIEHDVMGGGPNPDEYPEPGDAPAPEDEPPTVPAPEPTPEAEPETPSVIEDAKNAAKDKAKDVITSPDFFSEMKSLVKSKIAWLQGLALTGAAGASTSDDGIWHELVHLAHKPMFWFVLIVIISAGLTVFFRWYDHGRGQK